MTAEPPATSFRLVATTRRCRAHQHDRVLAGVKARRFAPPPLREADGPDAGCAPGPRRSCPTARERSDRRASGTLEERSTAPMEETDRRRCCAPTSRSTSPKSPIHIPGIGDPLHRNTHLPSGRCRASGTSGHLNWWCASWAPNGSGQHLHRPRGAASGTAGLRRRECRRAAVKRRAGPRRCGQPKGLRHESHQMPNAAGGATGEVSYGLPAGTRFGGASRVASTTTRTPPECIPATAAVDRPDRP